MSRDLRSPSGALLVAPQAEDEASRTDPQGAGEQGSHEAPLTELATLRVEAKELRAEVVQLRQLTHVLVELLADKGFLDADELRARIANARRPVSLPSLPHDASHPYRGAGKSAEPPPPGTVACARCGTFVAERKVFMNADGRFCRDCFEPG